MKKLSLVFGVALVALIAIVGYRNNLKNDPSAAKVPARGYSVPRGQPESDASSSHVMRPAPAAASRTTDPKPDGEDVKNLRRELEAVRAQLEKVTRPLEQNTLSSTVNAEINSGETLVTGGYKTPDGNYELILLTPSSVTLEDGSEAVEIESKFLSVGSEFVGAHGLETLATNARNTLQHAEAWMREDTANTLQAARKSEGVGILSAPKVVTLPSQPFTLILGETGGDRFTVDGTVARSPGGKFAIQSRVERIPKAEAGARGGDKPPN